MHYVITLFLTMSFSAIAGNCCSHTIHSERLYLKVAILQDDKNVASVEANYFLNKEDAWELYSRSEYSYMGQYRIMLQEVNIDSAKMATIKYCFIRNVFDAISEVFNEEIKTNHNIKQHKKLNNTLFFISALLTSIND